MSYLPPFWFAQFRDALGNPLSNAKLYSYENLSTIPKPLYTDHELLFPHTNPIDLDSYGYLPTIFLTSGYYTFALKDINGLVVKTADWIEGSLGANTEIGSSYTLSAATASTLGGIKVGNGLAIDGSGVLSVISVSAEPFSLSAYATLSGSNFTGPITAPTMSANSISAIYFETSSTKISDIESGIKIEGKTNPYNTKINLGPENSELFFETKDGQLRIAGFNSYVSIDAGNTYITSGSLIVGDQIDTRGTKSLINYQQFQQWYPTFFYTSSINFDKFKGKQLITTNAGNLSGIEIGTIKLDNTDPALGYIKSKFLPGSGIKFTEITDPTLGKVISINSTANSWRKQTNVNTSYVVTDNDDTICVQGYSTVTLPNPSVDYRGRIVTVLGVISGISWNVNSVGNITGDTGTMTDYDELTCKCCYTGTNYTWIVKKI